MALSGILVALPPPDPKADLVGYDFVPAMRMASRILPEGRGGVYEIEPSHELTRFREDLEELTASLDAVGADRVAFEDIGCEDVIRMRADFTYGYVVVASRPESYETWVEGPLPGHAGLEELLGGLVRRGEMPREDFLEEVRIGLGGGPGLGA